MHVIRLRGPWEFEVLARTRRLSDGTTISSTDDLPQGGKVEMPCSWGESLGADFRGRVRYRRQFGCPTNLSPQQSVALVVGPLDAFGTITLNRQLLAEVAAGVEETRIEVAQRLETRNELLIEVELPSLEPDAPALSRPPAASSAGGLIGPVALEIEE